MQIIMQNTYIDVFGLSHVELPVPPLNTASDGRKLGKTYR